MTRLKWFLPFISLSLLSCQDIGTDVNWSEWDLVKYQNASFSVPPHATWFNYFGAQLVREGNVQVDGDHFVFWLNYGRGLQELYNTYRSCLSSEVRTTIDGRGVTLTHFRCDPMGNDGPQQGMSVFISDVGDGENQFLLLVLHYDASKEYIADLIANTIHIQ
jgi:hypothetical protein